MENRQSVGRIWFNSLWIILERNPQPQRMIQKKNFVCLTTEGSTSWRLDTDNYRTKLTVIISWDTYTKWYKNRYQHEHALDKSTVNQDMQHGCQLITTVISMSLVKTVNAWKWLWPAYILLFAGYSSPTNNHLLCSRLQPKMHWQSKCRASWQFTTTEHYYICKWFNTELYSHMHVWMTDTGNE